MIATVTHTMNWEDHISCCSEQRVLFYSWDLPCGYTVYNSNSHIRTYWSIGKRKVELKSIQPSLEVEPFY